MKNTLLKFSDEAVKKLAERFASAEFQTQLKELKDSTTDNGTFRMVISTDQVDRHGEVVSQDGWLTDNYMKNGVVLWGHDSYSIPVGITDKLITEIQDGVKKTIAEGRFASHEFAQVLRGLYDEGMLNASSVGFIPLEYDGNTITKAELLEWSFVSIPANPFALASRGYDLNMLVSKGVIKEVQEGEEVITPPAEVKEEEEVAVEEEEVVTTETTEEGEVTDVDSEVVDETTTLSITLASGEVKKFKCAATFKAGRVLSKANRTKVESAVSALEEVLSADNSEENALEVTEGVKTDKEVEEATAFLKLRGSLQGLSTVMGEVLAEAKKDAKSLGIKVR